ncbi:MAG: hydantoinase/oxoprolinase family protein, partial [Rhodospirillales bacterium]|nr:hydantoinase/oxoprolinase family protein [Rhodospirillales bacterium]
EIIQASFEDAYRKSFGRLLDGIAMRVLNLRVTVVGRRPKFDLTILRPSGDTSVENARIDSRQLWVEGKWWEADIYSRLDLPEGASIPGPALLEQPDTTIFIDPDLAGEVDHFGNLIISRKDGK